MASKRSDVMGNIQWGNAFWFAGIAMFVLELGAGLDYVQAQLAALLPSSLGNIPVVALAAWQIAESAFWNYGRLENTFLMMPFITLPFVLLGLAISMKQRTAFAREPGSR